MSNDDLLPFELTHKVRDSCLCLDVQRTARALARRYDEALRPTGLTNGQFSILMSLNRPRPPAIRDIARLLAMDRTTLTAALKPLERKGLLTVSVAEGDRRSRHLALTAAGRALMAEAVPLWMNAQAETERLLAASDVARLRLDLRSLSGEVSSFRASRTGH
ncbi:MAG: MarR family winged helix-turn-helix transcriptional regulator [Kiloniellales bacterium]